MSYKYILNERGDPAPCHDLMTWAKWFENADHRKLLRDELPNGVSVSTVFLGMDHNYRMNGPPVLWETMIFGGERDEYQERYTSREEAIEGHKRAVAIACDQASEQR